MGIREHKITEKQIADYGLTSLPDLLTGTANENKTAMQQLLVLIGIPAINAVIDELGTIEDDTRNWGEAESLRVLQEAARAAAEAARQSAEQGRDTAEQARAAAEVLRQSAEQARAQAEQGRTDAETARQSAEQARVRAEDARSAAERVREQAEAARASAEQGRSAAEAARNVWEDYDGTRTYTPGNKVQHGGSSYVNIRACTGVTPPDSTYWQMIAAKGQSGDGSGDMLKSEYDPGGRNADIWAVRQIEDGGTGANNPAAALARLGAGVRPNLLLNPFFAVNQRGQTSYTTNGYTVDRWYLIANTETLMTVQADGVVLTASSQYGSYLYQIIPPEEVARLRGETVCFSALCGKNDNAAWYANIYVDNQWRDSFALTPNAVSAKAYAVPEDAQRMHLSFGSGAAGSCKLRAAKVELGNTQTLGYQDEDGAWHLLPQPESDYATQLARCQRYYWQSEMLYATNNYVSSAYLLCNVRYPVRMRTTPAVTLMSHLGTPNQVSQWGSGVDSGIAISVNSAYANCEGFDSIVATSGAFLDVERYAFRVAATAEL